jgi:hypothetical protein
MSYHGRNLSRYRTPIGSIEDWFSGDQASSEDQMRCINVANESPAVRRLEARIADLTFNWKPTGIFTGGQITKLMDALALAANEARDILAKLPQSKHGIVNSRFDLDLVDRRIAAYRAAVAASGGKKIPAPDLKKEYTRSLTHVLNAYVTSADINCLLTRGDRMAAAIDRAVDFAKSVLGGVLEFAEKAADAIKAPFSVIAWLGNHPYVPIGIVALILYKRFGR